MSFDGFLKDLFETGRVQVPRVAPLADEELAEAAGRLEVFELPYRRQLAGTPLEYALSRPPFGPPRCSIGLASFWFTENLVPKNLMSSYASRVPTRRVRLPTIRSIYRFACCPT